MLHVLLPERLTVVWVCPGLTIAIPRRQVCVPECLQCFCSSNTFSVHQHTIVQWRRRALKMTLWKPGEGDTSTPKRSAGRQNLRENPR